MSNPGIKWGIIAGVVAILVNIIVWQVSHELFFSFVLGMILLVVFVLFSVLAGLQQKRALGGFIDFKQALKPVFLTFPSSQTYFLNQNERPVLLATVMASADKMTGFFAVTFMKNTRGEQEAVIEYIIAPQSDGLAEEIILFLNPWLCILC